MSWKMYEPEGKGPGGPAHGAAKGDRDTLGGFVGETDRVNGEYHFKNGYTEKIYSDAHYVPASENTVPPRYYTPPERPVKEPKPRGKRRSGAIVGTVCLSLVCALLGGGAAGHVLSGRIDDLEAELQDLRETQKVQAAVSSALPVSTATPATAVSMSGGDIYEQACLQVVGISSELTYTNIFGMTSSSPVVGSGFVISEDGYILTNYHVIEQADSSSSDIHVIFRDGTQFDASVVGKENDGSDVAVLKIDAVGLTPASLGNSDEMCVGDNVYVVGNPLGELEFSQTQGHVSALDRLITTDSAANPINMFQIDAAVNHGNSGGPVYNSQGQVIGIVTAKYSDTGVEGLGFAIPINEAASIAGDLITKGYVTGKAYLGVEIDKRYNSMYSQYYGMPLGAYVDSVTRGGCAARAGLQPGDIITMLGGEEVSSYEELRTALRQFSAGDTAQVNFYRAGESLSASVTFDEEQPGSSTYRASSASSVMGLS